MGHRVNAVTSDGSDVFTVMYPLTQDQADQISAKSLIAQFPEAQIVRVEYPHKGYLATYRLSSYSHDFTIRALPAKGRDKDGNIVSGFVFEIVDNGALLLQATMQRPELMARILEQANVLAKPLTIVK